MDQNIMGLICYIRGYSNRINHIDHEQSICLSENTDPQFQKK